MTIEGNSTNGAGRDHHCAVFPQGASKDHELLVHHKVCHARVLDYRRKFLEAAQRYIDLSYIPEVDPDERMHALSNAIICTILASTGRSRSKKLATLFKVWGWSERLDSRYGAGQRGSIQGMGLVREA